jgi:hypothetical protein
LEGNLSVKEEFRGSQFGIDKGTMYAILSAFGTDLSIRSSEPVATSAFPEPNLMAFPHRLCTPCMCRADGCPDATALNTEDDQPLKDLGGRRPW